MNEQRVWLLSCNWKRSAVVCHMEHTELGATQLQLSPDALSCQTGTRPPTHNSSNQCLEVCMFELPPLNNPLPFICPLDQWPSVRHLTNCHLSATRLFAICLPLDCLPSVCHSTIYNLSST